MIDSLIHSELLIVNEAARIYRKMIVNVVTIRVRGEDILIFAFQELVSKLLADFVCLFGCDFSWFKRLNQMPGEIPGCIPHISDSFLTCHFKCPLRRFRGTSK